MKNFTAIFDMDGTLVDNTPYHFRSWQALFKNHNLGELSLDTYKKEISGVPIIETLRRLFGDRYDEAGLQELLNEKETVYRELYAPFLRPVNGLENFLTELKNAGIKMAIASSATVADIDFILNKIPIRDDFEIIIDGSRVSKGKPNPQIFLKAAESLNSKPADCVVFEDSIAGIKAANAAGMKVVGITTGHPAADLQPSNLVIDDYSTLTVQKLAALLNNMSTTPKEQNSIPTSKVQRSSKFVKTGFKIGGNYIKHYSKKLFNPDMDNSELNEDNASDIYESLSELKGSALKVAQMLSMDKNLLPTAYVDKFSQSQYNAPPLSGPLIVQTFKKYFGKNPEQIYDKFNIRSKNAASIGQVHEAELNGKKLAVKIQYPGVGDSISSDLKLVKPFAFRLLGMSEKELDVYMREVEERLLEETDYELEIRRSIEFSKACANLDNIVFPIYYPELSSKRIITMDWLEGQHLKEFLATNPSQKLRNIIGQALWDFYNFQQHELRAVHADPHPGNFMITPDGKLGVIDFGCIKEMPDDFYSPFFSLTSTNLLDNKEETIKAFRLLDMIHADDSPKQVEFYYEQYKQMIGLFAMPYIDSEFDFGETKFFDELYSFGERISKMPEFKQARGVKHFIYMNRTNFGLYNILHELKAKVKTDTYKPHITEQFSLT